MPISLPKKDISNAGGVLADAFRDDPLWQIFFEGESHITNKMRFCFETVLRYCHRFGEVYATTPNLEGVAAWVPGHLSYMTLWKMIRSGAIFPGMRMGPDAGRKMSAVFSPLEYDRKANMKGNAFVYLFIIGVGNQWRGAGIRRHVAARFDRSLRYCRRRHLSGNGDGPECGVLRKIRLRGDSTGPFAGCGSSHVANGPKTRGMMQKKVLGFQVCCA